MTLRITHRSAYRYDGVVSHTWDEAHMLPRDTGTQQVHAATLHVEPEPVALAERRDVFGNRVVYFEVDRDFSELVVTAVSEVSVHPPDDDLLAAARVLPWEAVRDAAAQPANAEAVDARRFTFASPFVPVDESTRPPDDVVAECFAPGTALLDCVAALMRTINGTFDYDTGFTTTATPLSEVIAHRRGVCQDFAHLALAWLRHVGLPARYVSGYIETVPPPGHERLVGADASHAWFSVWVPELGWIDADPTNALHPEDGHVTTSWGRDYGDVTPLKGVVLHDGRSQQLDVSVDVARI